MKKLVLDISDFNEFIRLEPQSAIANAGAELLSLEDYDAISIGNNEWVEGIEVTEALADSNNVPFLHATCINIFWSENILTLN